MKTVILLLCAVLIGFGYLLSEQRGAQGEIARLQQQVSQLERDKRALQTQLDATLAQLAQNQEKERQLTQQNAAQAETIRQLNLTIADHKRQITDLQARLNRVQTRTSIQQSLASVLVPGMILPAIPAVLATTYLVVRARKPTVRKNPKTTETRSTWVQLTDREIEKLIQLRRTQYQ